MSKEQPENSPNPESLTRRESVRALIRDGDDILLIKRTRIKDGDTSVYYVLPGGGIEVGEDVETALKRELQEELSSDSVISQKLSEFSSRDKDTLNIQHIYECAVPSRSVTLSGPEALRQTEDNKYELEWIPLGQAKNLNVVPAGIKRLVQELE